MSAAESIDKATILQLKTERITDPSKQALAKAELESLSDLPDVGPFRTLLYHINSVLWDVEDQLRVMEARDAFDEEFVLLARSVYFTNDLRAFTKARISKILKDKVLEVKSY